MVIFMKTNISIFRVTQNEIRRIMNSLLTLSSLVLAPTLTNANVVGLDTQTFNPTGDQLGFVTIHSGKTIKKGILGLSLFLDYTQNSQLVYSLPISDQNQLKHRDQAMGLQTGLAYGLGSRFQIGTSMPFVLMQNPIGDQPRSVSVTKGLNSVKFYGKYNFFNSEDYGNWSVVAAEDYPNVQNDPVTGLNPSPVTDLELGWSTLTSNFQSLGANVGYRFRKPGALPDNASMFPVGNQYIYSLGFGTPINEDRTRRLVTEIYGSMLDSSNSANRIYKNAQDASSMEFLGAIKTQVGLRQFFTYGATFGLIQPGLGADWRLFVGYNFYFAPGKGDTVPTTDPLLWSRNHSHSRYTPANNVTLDDSSSYDRNALDQSIIDDLIKSSNPPKIVAQENTSNLNRNETVTQEANSEFTSLQKTNLTQDIMGEVEQDSDNDGVPDGIDKCPNTRLGAVVDRWGCEIVTVKMVMPKPQETFVLEDVLFEFNKSELSTLAYPVLGKVIRNLKKKKYKTIEILGHADAIGSQDYNYILSIKRARTVRRYLINNGIDFQRIRIHGKGKSEPIATNKTAEGRQRNRRVVINMFNKDLQ